MRRKIILAVVVVAAISIAVGVATAESGPSSPAVGINAPASIDAGADFVATVDATDVTDFDAANYDVTFDPDVLQVTDVSAGLMGGITIPVDMWAVTTAGTVRVIQNVPEVPGVNGSGYLAEIQFQAVATAGGTSDIVLSSGVLGDIHAQEIATTWAGDSVSVNASTTTPTPAPTTAPTPDPDGGDGYWWWQWLMEWWGNLFSY